VYSYEPVTIIAEDEASQTRYGENTFAFEMPYQGNIAVGLEAAAYLLARGKDPLTQVDQMLFLANNSDALMTQALVREISDRIGLAETTTGIDNDDEPKGFFINAVEFDIREQMIRCAWILIPTDRESYWILESAGFSELDATTRPAFGIFT
jgi:3-oxoacyl-[acyl-carrier-protein] synthase III